MSLDYIKKPTYDTIFNISIFFFFLCVFSLNKNIVGAYYLLAILGILSIKTKNIRITDASNEIKYYIYIVFSLVALVTLSIFLYNPDALFKFRYAVFRDLVLIPLVFTGFYASNIKPETFYKIITVSSLTTIIWVIMILIEQPERKFGWLADPVNRGNIGMLAGVICLAATFYFNDISWKLIAGIGFISGTILSILTGTRGGWLAFLIVTITLLYQLSKTNKAVIKYLLSLLIIFVVIVSLFWGSLPISSRIDNVINSYGSYVSGADKNTSLGIRFELWRASWYAFLEKPLFGWGWNNFDVYLAHFRDTGLLDANAVGRDFGHPHNQYFLFLGELGFIGFITFSLMLIYPIQYFIRKVILYNSQKDRSNAFVFLLPIIAYEAILEFCMVDDSLSQRHFMLPLIIITIMSFTFASKIEKNKLSNSV